MESPSKHGGLPEDVLFEILMRLPVKNLLQFKSVCKHWYALIESPNFVNRHFVHESNQEHLLIRHYKPDNERDSYALYYDTLSEYVEPDYLQMPVTVEALMGPINGIFCVIGISGRLALLNPATRQFEPIPLLHLNVEPHLSSYDDLLGFGFDPLSGDYKLVTIHYFWNEEMDTPHYPCLVSVYNLIGNNSWRHFEDVDLVNSSRCAYRSLCNTYSNGVYYWLTEYNGTDEAILAFDMSIETFHEIHVPDCIKTKESDLALYDDSIALLACDLDKVYKCVDVWVMTKDGCWCKNLTVGPFQDIKWPLGFRRNNEFLLETEDSFLTMYDVCTKELRSVESRRKENGFFIYRVFSYKESLVSFNVKAGHCKQWEWDAASDFVKDLFK